MFPAFQQSGFPGPTAGFPHKLPMSLGQQAPEAGKRRPLGTGSSAAFGWDTAEVALALEAGAEFLRKGPSDHGQLTPSLLHTLAVVSHTLPPRPHRLLDLSKALQPPAPHTHHPSFSFSLPAALLIECKFLVITPAPCIFACCLVP